MAKKKQNQNVYNEDSIQVKEFPYNVQARPTMYIGELGLKGNNHLVKEVVDNSVDEHLNGFGDIIDVSISNQKGYCKVVDRGRGIPAKAITKAFTILHSSGKFDKANYSVSAGLNGVGTTAVNALSKCFKVRTVNDGIEYHQVFKNGFITQDLTKGEKVKDKGTTITFYPNEEIMETHEFNMDELKDEFEMKSYVNAGLKFNFKDVDAGKTYTYYHKDGLVEYITTMSKKLLVNPIKFGYKYHHKKTVKEGTGLLGPKADKEVKVKKEYDIDIEIVLSWENSEKEITKSFCNSLYTSDGGTHVTGLKLGIVNVVKKYIDDNNMLTKKDAELEIGGDEVRSGLIAVVAVKHPDPLYDSQTKNKVTNTELQGAVQKAINEEFAKWAEDHPKEMKIICNKVILAARAALAAKKAKELANKKGESALSAISDISKLSKCNSKNPEECEIFFVEGDSAGGTARTCRNRDYQAVYALRGKPLNSNNLQIHKILENKEYADATYILTGKRNGIGADFRCEDLKYHKVIIMADADVDGLHIQSLLTCHFFRHMRPLIEGGYLYIAMPPLYRITLQGGKFKYFLNDDELDRYINDDIFKNYSFISKGKKFTSEKNISTVWKLLKKYYEFVDNFATEKGINIKFLDEISTIYRNNGCDSLKEFASVVKSIGGFKFFKNSKGKNEFSGIYKNCFINEVLSELYDFVKELKEYADNIKLPPALTFEGNGVEEGYTAVNYKNILDAATPKSKLRMKGLGEMDEDELWDTTMNPETRNLIQVTLDDIEAAESVMDDLMNSDSKYADKRKVFLLKNQSKAKNLDI